MPKPKKYSLTEQEVNNMTLIANNKVLVKIEVKNTERKTKGGIIMIAETDTDWQKEIHANRWGRVINVPKRLIKEKYHLWTTECELQRNDLVWFDVMISENCDTIITELFTYLLIDYFSLHVAKRGDEIIPLNGYQMFDVVADESESVLAIKTHKLDARYGVLKHKGSLNKYLYGGLDDDERIQVGDKCVFTLPPVMLESDYHAVFGEKLRISQLYNICAFIHNDALHATINHIIIEPEIPTHRGGIEIPLHLRKPNGIGKIYNVNCPHTEMKIGDTVRYIPEACVTIDFNGQKLHICHQDYILYYLQNL